ncbi:Bromodomain, conserved site,Transcription initiation factor TFIID subunit 1, domain of unknown [Cinara cedri]|uniref:Bromo domain-containing protein n=1 Tax=Cinara cedri TaxID=506608 RepID=A0A5E4MD84_9HEMI|nr:Bromodomain, conserved site,Transcription initiation factor TFIID subunit 1, domain of unknown [Cinara cedri]
MSSSKYENVDITTLFPDFRVNKPLRFLRLFKSSKSNLLPKVWRHVQTKCKKKIHKYSMDSPFPIDDFRNSDPELEILLGQLNSEFKQEYKYCSNNQAHWRIGPAKLFYDMMGVPENVKELDYGFKLKDNKYKENRIKENPYPDDAYLMVSQLYWEDDIIWNGDDKKHEVIQKMNNKTSFAGWTLYQPSNGNCPLAGGSVCLATKSPFIYSMQQVTALIHNIFPVENEELLHGTWEDEIIWDAQNMEKMPYPKILILDPNDENIILNFPNDEDLAKQMHNSVALTKSKMSHFCKNKSKILNSKVGVINANSEDISLLSSKSSNRDPFNVSNDYYYQSKVSDKCLKYDDIQHSIPVLELRKPFIPTFMGPVYLRNFHRPSMKRYSHGTVAQRTFHPVYPLTENIKIKAKLRKEEQITSGGSNVFFMKTPDDLTGRDGSIILIEYCEEYPPLLSQVGMCSKIKNYYKCNSSKDPALPALQFGETVYAHNELFLGILSPGKTIQVIENNLFRAPIYEHKLLDSDFLLIRTRDAYYVREIDALFTSGQLCPLYEVPGPKAKNAKLFVTNFIRVFIYRLFWKSNDCPKRLRMDDVKQAFPQYSETKLRNILKLCADFKRTGSFSNWWILKPNFYLPPEEEIRAMVSPEQCCAYFSMIAAEQRLQDAGYGVKCILASLEDDNEEIQLKLDDEIKVAPWNTTRAYIQAAKKKCLLQLTGPADPTGCGEGFSYVRITNKSSFNKKVHESLPIKRVIGLHGDLRRWSLTDAKNVIKKFAVPEEEIQQMSRWKMIDLVRKLCTENANANKKEMNKFYRGKHYSIIESYHERYKKECQRIFDLQNQVLSSYELLSTDDEADLGEDNYSDIEKMGKSIEFILTNTKTSTELSKENEEQDRLRLYKMLTEEHNNNIKKVGKKGKYNDDYTRFTSKKPRRVLKIYRTYQGLNGKKFTRVETVRNMDVIDAYIKIKTSNENFTNHHMYQKEIKFRNQIIPDSLKEKDYVPYFVNPDMFINNAGNHLHTVEDNLVNNVEIKHNIENTENRSLILKIPKGILSQKKRKNEFDCDYLKKCKQSPNKLHTDLLTVLSNIFESILNEICNIPDVHPFIYPVDAKKIPDYYNIVQRPMDLQKIRAKIHLKKYKNREQLLYDLNQIVVNCTLYNGKNSSLTAVAHNMLCICVNRIEEKEKEIILLEKAI